MPGENANLTADLTNINVASMTGSTEQYPALVEAIKSAIGNAEKAKESKEDKSKTYRLWQKLHLLSKGDYDLSERHMKMTQDKFDKSIKNGAGFAASMAKYANAMGIVLETVKQIAIPAINETKKRMNWLSELEKSGVHLAEGFDDSFTDLANTAKMSHDNFARMLIANSRQVAKLNAIGLNGARTFSNALNKTVGKFGYTTDEASTALSSYMENILGFYSNETLAEKLKNDATTKYLKSLKELSAATGKSVDLLAQENQLKEDTLFAQKLNAEHPELYGALKQAGLTDPMIKALVSGRPNEEFALAHLTPEGAEIASRFGDITRRSLSGSLTDDKLYEEIDKVIKSEATERGRKGIENMDHGTASVLSESSGHNTGLGFFHKLNKGFDVEAAKKVGGNKGDTDIVNSFIDYQAEKDKLGNNWNKALAFSAKHASDALDFLTIGLKFLNGALGTFAGSFIAYGILFGKTKGGLWTFSKIMQGFHAIGDKRFHGTMIEKFLKGMFGSKFKNSLGVKLTNSITGSIKDVFKKTYDLLPFHKAVKKLASSITKLGGSIGKFTIKWLGKIFGFVGKWGLKLLSTMGSLLMKFLPHALVGALAGGASYFISKMFGASERTANWSATGAALGATIGSFLSPVGTLIGGIAGGLIGAGIGAATGPAQSNTEYKFENNYNTITEKDVATQKVANEQLAETKKSNEYMKVLVRRTTDSANTQDKQYKHAQFMSMAPA